uniref:NOT2/NOT3/NOT5 C-terminal domain-containing protein n=1 Tax=Meloidogyne enterolobii TaxID=390850 RepID=A0A6V7XSY3_MELEN|nr:unnamed protein product [Meloidogyne enterolobii]
MFFSTSFITALGKFIKLLLLLNCLYARDWRFHKIERFWLQRAAFSAPPREIGGTYERCQYNAFDPIQWRRVPREMILEYKDLEGKPAVPFQQQHNNSQQQQSSLQQPHQLQQQQHQNQQHPHLISTTNTIPLSMSSIQKTTADGTNNSNSSSGIVGGGPSIFS